jgi:amino acid transporter
VSILKYLNNISVWWHALGTTSLVITVLAAAPKRQSAKFVFQTFIDRTGGDGVGWSQRASPAYVAVIGVLMAQYTLTGQSPPRSETTVIPEWFSGFDASAHMTEETRNAAVSGSVGIIMSIGVSALLGWFLILGLLFSIQDYETTVSSSTGQPVSQIFLDTVGEKGAIGLMVSQVSWNGGFIRRDHDWFIAGGRDWRDVLVRVRLGPSPVPSDLSIHVYVLPSSLCLCAGPLP